MSEGGDSQAGTAVLPAKLARRKLQHDVELLSNRVERLRAEERKAKQKVLETKLRGQEIAALQQRNEQAAQAKALAKRMEEEQRMREQQERKLALAEQAASKKANFQKMYEIKRVEVQRERQVKAENAGMLRQLKEYEEVRAREARNVIRERQKTVSDRFEKQRQAHQEFLAQDFINMIAMEDRRREEVEKEIVAMEAEERKHIERLKALQDEQKNAYDNLEQALANR